MYLPHRLQVRAGTETMNILYSGLHFTEIETHKPILNKNKKWQLKSHDRSYLNVSISSSNLIMTMHTNLLAFFFFLSVVALLYTGQTVKQHKYEMWVN